MGLTTVSRSNLACLAAVGVGAVLGVGGVYLYYKMNSSVQRELAYLSSNVEQLRKEIAELKSLTKRKVSGGSDTDVYYDFSDDGEEELFDLITGLSVSASEEENLIAMDYFAENMAAFNNYEFYLDLVLNLKNKFYNNTEFLWRLAKTFHGCGVTAGSYGNASKKKDYVFEARKYAAVALALIEDCAAVHKWYAIAVGSCSEFESIPEKIKDGFTFKEHILTAMKLDPTDDSLLYLMGRWCFEVSLLSWLEKKMATALFGDIPHATVAEARNYFLEVEQLRKVVWKENRLFIAKTYVAESNYTQAIMWLDKAANSPIMVKSDILIVDEINKLRTKYSAYRGE